MVHRLLSESLKLEVRYIDLKFHIFFLFVRTCMCAYVHVCLCSYVYARGGYSATYAIINKVSPHSFFVYLFCFAIFPFVENRFLTHTVPLPLLHAVLLHAHSHSDPLCFCLSLEKDRFPRDNKQT